FFRAIATEPLAYARKIGWQMWFAMMHSMDHFDLQDEARSDGMQERSRYPDLEHIYPPTAGTIHGFVSDFPTRARQLLERGPWLPAMALLIALAAIFAASWKPFFPIVVI